VDRTGADPGQGRRDLLLAQPWPDAAAGVRSSAKAGSSARRFATGTRRLSTAPGNVASAGQASRTGSHAGSGNDGRAERGEVTRAATGCDAACTTVTRHDGAASCATAGEARADGTFAASIGKCPGTSKRSGGNGCGSRRCGCGSFGSAPRNRAACTNTGFGTGFGTNAAVTGGSTARRTESGAAKRPGVPHARDHTCTGSMGTAASNAGRSNPCRAGRSRAASTNGDTGRPCARGARRQGTG
jgi:hypothetical protein